MQRAAQSRNAQLKVCAPAASGIIAKYDIAYLTKLARPGLPSRSRTRDGQASASSG